MGLSTFSVEPWCGNRLAVCVLHIACSQRLRRSEQNNNHKSGLSAECQDCLVVGSLQRTRGTLLSFAGKKCLRSQIPQTGHMLLGMKRVNHSPPRFACVMLGLDDDDSLQVLTPWLKSQKKHPRVEQGGRAYSSWKYLSYKNLYTVLERFQSHCSCFSDGHNRFVFFLALSIGSGNWYGFIHTSAVINSVCQFGVLSFPFLIPDQF